MDKDVAGNQVVFDLEQLGSVHVGEADPAPDEVSGEELTLDMAGVVSFGEMVVDPVGDPALADVDEAFGVGSHRPVDTDRPTRGRRISKVQPSELEPCCGSGVVLEGCWRGCVGNPDGGRVAVATVASSCCDEPGCVIRGLGPPVGHSTEIQSRRLAVFDAVFGDQQAFEALACSHLTFDLSDRDLEVAAFVLADGPEPGAGGVWRVVGH